jgi:hypothetical protein
MKFFFVFETHGMTNCASLDASKVITAHRVLDFPENLSFLDYPNVAESFLNTSGNVSIGQIRTPGHPPTPLGPNPSQWPISKEVEHSQKFPECILYFEVTLNNFWGVFTILFPWLVKSAYHFWRLLTPCKALGCRHCRNQACARLLYHLSQALISVIPSTEGLILHGRPWQQAIRQCQNSLTQTLSSILGSWWSSQA